MSEGSLNTLPLDAIITKATISPHGAELLVFHVSLFLLGIIALLAFIRLPRAFARFWRAAEWTSGHFLWHTTDRPPIATKRLQRDNTYSSKASSSKTRAKREFAVDEKANATDDSHTLYSSHQQAFARSYDDAASVSYPPHVAAIPKFLQTVAAPFRTRVDTGLSLAQLSVLVLYFCVLVYAGLYKSSPFTDPVRTGWVAVSQVPFVIAFATKNNVLGMLLGFTYEKLNFLHRFLGRLVVLAINIHCIGYFYQWCLAGTFTQNLKQPFTAWGLVGLLAFDVVAFFSTSYWRRRAYNVFIASHIIGFSIILPALMLHKPAITPYVLVSYGIYGFDCLLRFIKTRVCTAVIRPLAELDSTRIEVPYLNAGWRAGQHVRLRVLTFGLGWWGWTEMHPFTIASVSKSQEGLVLIAKKSGTWTNRLYTMAKEGGLTEAGIGRNVKVMIEGPYGGPGHTMFTSFSGAVFVVGGSGITFALSAVQDLIQQDLKGRSRVKIIELIWIVQDPASVQPFLPLFVSMIEQSVYTPVHISVHYTRAALSGKRALSLLPHPALTLTAGRPRVQKVLDAAISRAVSLGAGAKDSQRINGLLVGVCGPAALGDDVSKAVGMVDPARRDQVGGIEMHEEVFGW